MASPYRVIICDLRTDQLLDVLPVTGLSFDDFIGKMGTCSGTIEITDTRVAARMRLNFIPARTAVYVQRGADIWWGGIMWTRTVQVDSRGYVKVAFQASTFDSYFDKRKIYDTQTFVGEEQLEIVRKLLDYAQGQTGGDIGITYDTLYSNVGRDRTYNSYDLLNIREQIDLLSNVDNGFEWRMRAYSDEAGRRVRNLQLGYPKIVSSRNDVMLSAPGQIISYSLPEDGTTTANYWQSRGASTNQDASSESVPLMSTRYFYPTDLDAGWPRLDGSSDYNTVEDLTTLDAHAVADIKRFRRPIVIPDIEVMLDGRNITPGLLGTTTRLRIKDIWYYEGITLRYRIIGFKVSPPDRGKPETATLYLEAL
ncbi:minor tail protein [Streptomyces phage Hiyaa]|uniref:Minor tail protein n=1 Tax=Streptomyces phage Hiyaa TaxID=2499072 RepID=A0A3S9U8M9_9CAUD|nr:minor tail protein [Streptomyces phage Hiyaa]AZS06665.1 minor tail protein [Streptomyces phage Hiyaa]